MATRPRVTIPRSYEDYQPPSNLLQEEDCETLIVDLPGFRKEQVRVQMEDRLGALLISGERPIGNNKWSRFRKDIRVPVNCNTTEIQAKFENGVLRIIMPLKVVPKTEAPAPKFSDTKKPIPTPPPPPPSPKPLTESKPTQKPQSPGTPNPVWDPLLTAQFPHSQKPNIGSKKPVPSTLSPPSQKLVTELKPSPALPEPGMTERPGSKLLDSKPIPLPEDPLNQSPPQGPGQLNKTQTIESNHPPTAKSALGIDEDHNTGKRIGSAEIVEKTDKPENAEIQEKEKLTGAQELKPYIKEKVGHVFEDHKGRGKRPAMEMDDSGQYILNMVAAVLVVIALWFYTKYTVKTFW